MCTLREQVEWHLEYMSAWALLAVALFPRLARLAYMPAYWGPKGVARYVVGFWAVAFAARQWLKPWAEARQAAGPPDDS